MSQLSLSPLPLSLQKKKMNPQQLIRDLSQSSDPRLRRARHGLSKAKDDLKLKGDLCNNVSHIYAYVVERLSVQNKLDIRTTYMYYPSISCYLFSRSSQHLRNARTTRSYGDYERAFRWAQLDLKICQQRRDAVATVIGLRVWYVIYIYVYSFSIVN